MHVLCKLIHTTSKGLSASSNNIIPRETEGSVSMGCAQYNIMEQAVFQVSRLLKEKGRGVFIHTHTYTHCIPEIINTRLSIVVSIGGGKSGMSGNNLTGLA